MSRSWLRWIGVVVLVFAGIGPAGPVTLKGSARGGGGVDRGLLGGPQASPRQLRLLQDGEVAEEAEKAHPGGQSEAQSGKPLLFGFALTFLGAGLALFGHWRFVFRRRHALVNALVAILGYVILAQGIPRIHWLWLYPRR